MEKKFHFTKKIDGFEIANKISKSLAKEACIMNVDGVKRFKFFNINKAQLLKLLLQKIKKG